MMWLSLELLGISKKKKFLKLNLMLNASLADQGHWVTIFYFFYISFEQEDLLQ